ncbi:hypothetical protein BD324DRAFT_352926 [Kockovaella imperatae]|uniref:Uncharacterized protein n=1 Tax=Kockovaella imperatae TaxID=4999 RepID=A0A1Y1UK76_9TREE|nr:hypothetical protein BD324DRAFT_352926 [Kockovaella imperatae]ORX38382.1 hypothetical protein BD324DRAFT_352926 [Kockovaella imperatae]
MAVVYCDHVTLASLAHRLGLANCRQAASCCCTLTPSSSGLGSPGGFTTEAMPPFRDPLSPDTSWSSSSIDYKPSAGRSRRDEYIQAKNAANEEYYGPGVKPPDRKKLKQVQRRSDVAPKSTNSKSTLTSERTNTMNEARVPARERIIGAKLDDVADLRSKPEVWVIVDSDPEPEETAPRAAATAPQESAQSTPAVWIPAQDRALWLAQVSYAMYFPLIGSSGMVKGGNGMKS